MHAQRVKFLLTTQVTEHWTNLRPLPRTCLVNTKPHALTEITRAPWTRSRFKLVRQQANIPGLPVMSNWPDTKARRWPCTVQLFLHKTHSKSVFSSQFHFRWRLESKSQDIYFSKTLPSHLFFYCGGFLNMLVLFDPKGNKILYICS